MIHCDVNIVCNEHNNSSHCIVKNQKIEKEGKSLLEFPF